MPYISCFTKALLIRETSYKTTRNCQRKATPKQNTVEYCDIVLVMSIRPVYRPSNTYVIIYTEHIRWLLPMKCIFCILLVVEHHNHVIFLACLSMIHYQNTNENAWVTKVNIFEKGNINFNENTKIEPKEIIMSDLERLFYRRLFYNQSKGFVAIPVLDLIFSVFLTQDTTNILCN